ncbi:flavonol sulfotransferase-like [Lycium ferocissimum]|uniref:flavonol sulfotransferase-like n=1 Tax=Lycium ferocissimum TaxID=112874 RepID=UPI0028150AA0|nr:flavonol sulfotransferase-like [Lycium ferocissimum]
MSSSSPPKVSRFSGVYSPENMKEMSLKYTEIISTLPKLDPPHPTYEISQYQGFWLPYPVIETILSMSEYFKAQPSDIYLCSFPKTGTTWLKALTFAIMTRDNFDDSTNPLLTKVPHDCVPFLEIEYPSDPTSLDIELPLLATHIPYTCLPPSIIESNCKIIYICREPKDTFVSWWHYGKKQSETFSLESTITLEQKFHWFHDGKSIYGPYWDHVLEFLKASENRPESVFFLTYEDLKSDTICYVKKLAEFMGKPFSEEEVNRGVVEKIVERCNIKSLSNLEVNKSGFFDVKPWKISNSSYFRKGEVGDWKNLLTEDMAKSIDHITHEKFHPVGLKFPSDNNTKD